MIIDIECPLCRGDGFIAERKVLIGTRAGVYEIDCPRCGGIGSVAQDLNEDADDDGGEW
jgi:DnaJ-class molecular chaperone